MLLLSHSSNYTVLVIFSGEYKSLHFSFCNVFHPTFTSSHTSYKYSPQHNVFVTSENLLHHIGVHIQVATIYMYSFKWCPVIFSEIFQLIQLSNLLNVFSPTTQVVQDVWRLTSDIAKLPVFYIFLVHYCEIPPLFSKCRGRTSEVI